MKIDELSPAQVIVTLLQQLSIGELRAVEDLAMERRIELQRLSKEKLKEILT